MKMKEYIWEKFTTKPFRTTKDENEINVELVCSTIKFFVDNLPFSIDPLSTKFVPAILLNAVPLDTDNHYGFEGVENPTLFKKLKEWNDTKKSAYSIQLCALLQEMLINGKGELIAQKNNS